MSIRSDGKTGRVCLGLHAVEANHALGFRSDYRHFSLPTNIIKHLGHQPSSPRLEHSHKSRRLYKANIEGSLRSPQNVRAAKPRRPPCRYRALPEDRRAQVRRGFDAVGRVRFVEAENPEETVCGIQTCGSDLRRHLSGEINNQIIEHDALVRGGILKIAPAEKDTLTRQHGQSGDKAQRRRDAGWLLRCLLAPWRSRAPSDKENPEMCFLARSR